MNSEPRLPCVQTRENPPFKGGCPKIGLDRRGGMNQNTPNPGVALKWPHPCSLPIEWGSRGCPPNANLRPRVVLDTQVWLPARDGDGMCCHPSKGIMINSRGERRTKALEGTEDLPTDSEQYQAEKPEGTDTVTTNHYMRLVEFSHVALGDPLAMGVGLWIKLILFIKHCNCNCNFTCLVQLKFKYLKIIILITKIF